MLSKVLKWMCLAGLVTLAASTAVADSAANPRAAVCSQSVLSATH